MNERIRKLIEEVVRVEIDPDSNMEIIYTCGPEDFEAFAELIVKECIDWCNAHSTINGTAQQIAESIKKHFGVES